MFDSIKMSAESFMLGLKHGVYVFVSDACEFCHSYQESLKYIDNANLHIVECTLDSDKSAIYQITGKGALPITASFIDGDMQWATLGELYELSDDEEDWTLTKLAKYLDDTFGKAPLTPEEITQKLEMLKQHCSYAFYIFPPNTSAEVKQRILSKAFEHGELPIDIDMIDSLAIDRKQKEIMITSNVAITKLVIFNINTTTTYSDLAKFVISAYVNSKRTNAATFEPRDLC